MSFSKPAKNCLSHYTSQYANLVHFVSWRRIKNKQMKFRRRRKYDLWRESKKIERSNSIEKTNWQFKDLNKNWISLVSFRSWFFGTYPSFWYIKPKYLYIFILNPKSYQQTTFSCKLCTYTWAKAKKAWQNDHDDNIPWKHICSMCFM